MSKNLYLLRKRSPVYRFAFEHNLYIKQVQELQQFARAISECKSQRQILTCQQMLIDFAELLGFITYFEDGRPVLRRSGVSGKIYIPGF